MKNTDQWWLRCSAVLRFMPGDDGYTMADITAALPRLAEAGIQAIHITAPYSSAGFYPWWGLRPLDYFAPNQALQGSMDDFARLVRSAHAYGLKVMIFLNIGYADVTSPLWQQTCRDIRSGTDNTLFRWSDRPDTPLMQPPGEHFLQGGALQWSNEAQQWYHSKWREGDIAEPQFDYASPATQQLVRRILEHWLDTGVDGVIVDAVNWYLNCNWERMRSCITDVIHRRKGVMCIPEGGTGFGDSFAPWITQGGYDVIDDQPFHSDIHWNGSAIADAVAARDPDLLHRRLAACREARAMGHVCWSYPSWGECWTAEMRLLETAVLLGTGHMTELIFSYLHALQPEQLRSLHGLLRLTRFAGLAPIEPRRRLPLPKGSACYACFCGSDESLLAVFNLASAGSAAAIHTRAVWTDCLSGEEFIPTYGVLRLPMSPLGWRFLRRKG